MSLSTYKLQDNHHKYKNTVYFLNCRRGKKGLGVGEDVKTFSVQQKAGKGWGKTKTRTEYRRHKIRWQKKNKYKYISNYSECCRQCVLCTPSNSLGFICLADTASGSPPAPAE